MLYSNNISSLAQTVNVCFNSVNPQKADFLVLFQDDRPKFIRSDQKFLHYKYGSVQRKFEYLKEIDKELIYRSSHESINARNRISSILDACQHSIDIIFTDGQVRVEDAVQYRQNNNVPQEIVDHENHATPIISLPNMICMVRSVLLDCASVVKDLGILPFLHYGDFVLRRLILNCSHLQSGDNKNRFNNDQNLNALLKPALTGSGH